MAGSRRAQRSVRVTMAGALTVAACILVVASVASARLVAPAAVVGIVVAAAATRIMYAEVTQSRWEAARRRAEQARSFQAVLDRTHADQLAYANLVSRRMGQRDRSIGELADRVRLLERQLGESADRIRREARRANEAQERLAAVLDEVLGTADPDVGVESDELARLLAVRSDPPTVTDLMSWQARSSTPRRDAAGA